MENREVFIKTILFSCLGRNWMEWCMQVQGSAAKKRGCYSTLVNNLSIIPTAQDVEEKAARIKPNDDAYHWLALSTSKRVFLHIESSQDNTYVAWTNLLDQ
jgi:hypothetical protein